MIYVRFIELFLFLICTCAVIAFASPSFGVVNANGDTDTPNQGNVAAQKQSPEIKKSSRPLPTPPKRTASERPQFTNLQQEDRVFGMPQNLNLDTLYKLNPQLWDEFRKSFPKVPSDIQPASIQPFFARFIQDYVLTAIYETHLPALSWYPEAKGFGWRDILNNPQYRDIMKSQQQANKGWFVSDVADWIQRSYIQSQKANAPLPWQPEETASTQASTVGAQPPPAPPPPALPFTKEVNSNRTWAKVEPPRDSATTSKTSKTNVRQPPEKEDSFIEKIQKMAVEKRKNLPSTEEMDRRIAERKERKELEGKKENPQLQGIGGLLFDAIDKNRISAQGKPENKSSEVNKPEEEDSDDWDEIEESTNTKPQPTTQNAPTQQSKDPLTSNWLSQVENKFKPTKTKLTGMTETQRFKALKEKTNTKVAMYEKREMALEEEKRILEDVDLLKVTIEKLKLEKTNEAKERLGWMEAMLPQIQAYRTQKNILEKRIRKIGEALAKNPDKSEKQDLEYEGQIKQNALFLLKNPLSYISARLEGTRASKATAQRELTAVEKKIEIRNEASKNLEMIIESTPKGEKMITDVQQNISDLNWQIEHLLSKYLTLEIEEYKKEKKSIGDTLKDELESRRKQVEEEEEDDDSWLDDDDSWLDD